MRLFSRECPSCKSTNTEEKEYYWRCKEPPEECDVTTFMVPKTKREREMGF